MSEVNIPGFSIVLNQEALQQIVNYKKDLISKKSSPGGNLERVIKTYTNQGNKFENVNTSKFIELILGTKKPKAFATYMKCDGKDYNRTEFEILGNLNIAVPVEIFDNGAWATTDKNFKQHDKAFEGELMYTPGPLLRKCRFFKGDTPDFEEVVTKGNLDQGKYNKLINRRLSPLFAYADNIAEKERKKAVIVIPGIGCGIFAGNFKGKLGKNLNLAIQYTLEQNGSNFKNIATIIFDPYAECSNETKVIEGVQYRVRPFAIKGNGKSQLEKPENRAESGDDFKNTKLFKVVAWDHVSWPGNNFFDMKRETDDGVAAAATSSMKGLTNVKGEYANGKYFPPSNYETWKQVVERNKIVFRAFKNVFVLTFGGEFLSVEEAEEKVLK